MRRKFVWAATVFLVLFGASASSVASQTAVERMEQSQATRAEQQKARHPDLLPLQDFAQGVIKNKKGRVLSIWENPALQENLNDLLGPDVFAKLYSWVAKDSVGTSPVLTGNILHTYAGKRHRADEQHVILFVYFGKNAQDPAANTIQLCWHQRTPKGETIDAWLASGQKARSLPKGACDLNVEAIKLLRTYGSATTGPWEIKETP